MEANDCRNVTPRDVRRIVMRSSMALQTRDRNIAQRLRTPGTGSAPSACFVAVVYTFFRKQYVGPSECTYQLPRYCYNSGFGFYRKAACAISILLLFLLDHEPVMHVGKGLWVVTALLLLWEQCTTSKLKGIGGTSCILY